MVDSKSIRWFHEKAVILNWRGYKFAEFEVKVKWSWSSSGMALYPSSAILKVILDHGGKDRKVNLRFVLL